MRPTYENVYIGTFIFTLGFMHAKKWDKDCSTTAINLYQQIAKPEKLIGDLLTSVNGKNIIVEFKRNKNGIHEEVKKKSKEDLIERMRSKSDDRFLSISKKCHFLSFPAPLEAAACLNFVRYFDAVMYGVSHSQSFKNNDFCNSYLDMENSDIGCNAEDFDYYINELCKVGEGTCGGMAINVNENGLQSFVVFDDVMELQKTIQSLEHEALEKYRSIENALAPKGRSL